MWVVPVILGSLLFLLIFAGVASKIITMKYEEKRRKQWQEYCGEYDEDNNEEDSDQEDSDINE